MAGEKAEEAIYAYHVNLIRRKTHDGSMIAWDKLHIDGTVVVATTLKPFEAATEAVSQTLCALIAFTEDAWKVERLVVNAQVD